MVSHFSCPLNDEVEFFLKNNALDFEAKNHSVTCLVFVEDHFVAYFTLANKLIQVQKDKISKTVLKRLQRVAKDTGDEFLNAPSILVAQLGKNFSNDNNNYITGQELLAIIEYFIKIVDSVKSFGVDYIKFQTGKPKLVTFKFAVMADYQKRNIGKAEGQFDMIKKIMLNAEDFPVLKNYYMKRA